MSEKKELSSITQEEFNAQFVEYIRQQDLPEPSSKNPNWKIMWYTQHLLEYTKGLEKQGTTVRAGYGEEEPKEI